MLYIHIPTHIYVVQVTHKAVSMLLAVCHAHSIFVSIIGYRELKVGRENISLDHALLRGHPKVCTD